MVSSTSLTYGLNFNRSDNSWGGLQNIRVEAVTALDAVVRVNQSHNGFMIDAFIDGNNIAKMGLLIDEGSAFFSEWLYTSALTEYNIHLNEIGNVSQVLFESGIHDVGTLGFVKITSTSSSAGVRLLNQRIEGVDAKDLISYNATGGAIEWTGVASSGTPNSLVRKVGGSVPRLELNMQSGNKPAFILIDDSTPSNSVVAVGEALRGRISVRDVHFPKDVYFDTNSLGIGGHTYYQRATGAQFDVWSDAVSLRFKDKTANQYMAVMSNKGVRIGTSVINDTGKEGVQISNGWHLNFDGGGFPVCPSFTVATLPSHKTGGMIFVSDETGGATLAFSDGANWRRFRDSLIVS